MLRDAIKQLLQFVLLAYITYQNVDLMSRQVTAFQYLSQGLNLELSRPAHSHGLPWRIWVVNQEGFSFTQGLSPWPCQWGTHIACELVYAYTPSPIELCLVCPDQHWLWYSYRCSRACLKWFPLMQYDFVYYILNDFITAVNLITTWISTLFLWWKIRNKHSRTFELQVVQNTWDWRLTMNT